MLLLTFCHSTLLINGAILIQQILQALHLIRSFGFYTEYHVVLWLTMKSRTLHSTVAVVTQTNRTITLINRAQTPIMNWPELRPTSAIFFNFGFGLNFKIAEVSAEVYVSFLKIKWIFKNWWSIIKLMYCISSFLNMTL